MEKENFILTIDTPDESGLIYKITKLISENHLNIIANDEFVDNSDNHFFMRTEVEGNVNKNKLLIDLTAVLPKNSTIKISGQEKKKVVILATKEHHCLGDLLIRNAFNDMSIEILAVISNYDTLKPLTDKFCIPFHYVSHENMTREEHEILIIDAIKKYSPE